MRFLALPAASRCPHTQGVTTPDAARHLDPAQPVDLARALATFDRLWSPRIVTRVNDYDVRVAKVAGEHMWHTHEETDEFFLVLEGELTIALRDAAPDDAADDPADDADRDTAARRVVLGRGSVFVVPRGTEHKPSSTAGASILMFEPTGTLTVGDRHDPTPDHVDATTGHALT